MDKLLRTPQTTAELEKQLDEQLHFLSISAEAYDKGDTAEAKRIASTLRILFHDGKGNTKSLIGQLGLQDKKFYDTAAQSEIYFAGGQRLGSFAGLLALTMGENGQYVPLFDESVPGMAEYANFSEYWERVVFIDSKGVIFTRKNIVLAVADQDGGAHVDGSIDNGHYGLSRENSMGWVAIGMNSAPRAPERPDLPALRQIAHEVLRSMRSDYPRRKMDTKGLPAMGPSISIVKNNDVFLETIKSWQEVGPYDLCPCSSGVKHRWCCGKKY